MKQRYPRIGLRFRVRIGSEWSDVWTVTAISAARGVSFYNPMRDGDDAFARSVSWDVWWKQLADRKIRLTYGKAQR